ncbi:MAG: V-type ATP synthase subunit D [Thermoplasmata archaeon]|nr:V-type ATP synthase subunit D [Thermoplasmata archaeon]
MAIREYKPTRSELLEVKKRIKFSEKGYDLLKKKRDGLILEFFDILEEAKKVRGSIIEKCAVAERKLAIAEAVEGEMGVKSAAFAAAETPTISLYTKNVMGVVVPKIKGEKVRKRIDERGYGLIGTSTRIDEAAEAYEELVEEIVRAAEIETTLKKLLEEISGTKRRVNALEFKVIPELKTAENMIMMRLEEMERENVFRLKRFKED